MTGPDPNTEPTVRHYPNGWDLVTAGTWEISIGPDGLIQLPRHLKPDEVTDFVAAVTVAAQYAAPKRAANLEVTVPPAAAPQPMMVREGGAAGGMTRMPVATRANPAASIGRSPRYQTGASPAGIQGAPGPRIPTVQEHR